MGYEHDRLAHIAATEMLAGLRRGTAGWATALLGTTSTYGSASPYWPKPDRVFLDRTNSNSLAMEFKPPAQPRREYVTGLGQALTYLDAYTYAALVMPAKSYDGYDIATYMAAQLDRPYLQGAPIALLVYDPDPSALVAVRNLRARATPPATPHAAARDVFWAYWRDLSQYDVFDILSRMIPGRVFDRAFVAYWNRSVMAGRALTWEGVRRTIRGNLRAYQLNSRAYHRGWPSTVSTGRGIRCGQPTFSSDARQSGAA